MEIVELRSWPVQIAMMVEQVQASQQLLCAAANEPHQPFGSNEAMLRYMAENLDVAGRDLE